MRRSWLSLGVCLAALCLPFSIASGQTRYGINTIAGGLPPATAQPASTSFLKSIESVAMDSVGNVYVVSENCVYKIDAAGEMTRVAGRGLTTGYAGDGGPATEADLAAPSGIATDIKGNLYIADTGNDVIRKVTPDGIISTVAGTGTRNFSGDGGLAINAELFVPIGVSVDGAGNLYILSQSYSSQGLVRKVTPDGKIQSLPITNSYFTVYYASAIAVDNAGTVYLLGEPHNMVSVVKPDGSVSCLASSGVSYPTYAGCLSLGTPQSIAVDGRGNVYVRSYEGLFRVGADQSSVRIGGGVAAPTEGAWLGDVAIYSSSVIASDAAGNLAIGSGYGGLYRVDVNGLVHVLTPRLQSNTPRGENGPAPFASFVWGPGRSTFDAAHNLYIGDADRVRKVTPDGIIQTFAGGGDCAGSTNGDGGPALGACLQSVSGLVFDASGNLYVADSSAGRIRKIDTHGVITTIAGGGTVDPADGLPATSVNLAYAQELAIDSKGNLYTINGSYGSVVKITPEGTLSVYAGNRRYGDGTPAGDGGPATSAVLVSTYGLALDTHDNLYIGSTAESGVGTVRKVDTNGIITTVAGMAGACTEADGIAATSACLSSPGSVAVDASGTLYIAESGTNRIRAVAPNGMITTLAGLNGWGYFGDGGPADQAALTSPFALSLDGAGNIYFSDSGNGALRVLTPLNARSTLSTTISHRIVSTTAPRSASFSLLVGNGEAALATSGAVTVSVILPTGYTLTSLDGPGWNCSVASANCTRSDPLPAWTVYPEISAVVQAGNGAPAQFTLRALTSGSGMLAPAGSSDAATFPPALAIYGATPTIASVGSTDVKVTLYGAGFSSTSVAQWNGAPLATTLVSPNQITATISASLITQTPNAARVRVVNTDGVASNEVPFTVTGASVSSVSPASMPAGNPGFTLTVTGKGFDATSVVRWNSSVLPTTFISATQLTAQVPASAIATVGQADVSVRNGYGALTNAVAFSIIRPPYISGVSPSTFTVGASTSSMNVFLNSATGADKIYWGSTLLACAQTSSTMTCTVPASLLAATGKFNLTVVGPTGWVSEPYPVKVLSAPTVVGFRPFWVTMANTPLTLTIDGTNFLPGATVTVNFSQPTTLTPTSVTDSQLIVTIPAALRAPSADQPSGTRSVSFSVTNPDGASVSGLYFVLSPAPIVTSITPNWALAGSGPVQITVRGQYLQLCESILWGTTPLPATYSNEASTPTLTATVPAALLTSAGVVNVSAVTLDSFSSNTVPVTINAATAPPQYLIQGVAGVRSAPPTLASPQINIGTPGDVAADGAGNTYFVAGRVIYKIDTQGVQTRVAGDATRIGCSGDGASALNALFTNPVRLSVDSGGRLYVADSGCNVIRMIDTAGLISTIAGNGTAGAPQVGQRATQSPLYGPVGVAVDGSGNVYFSAGAVYKIGTDGVISLYTGTGNSAPAVGLPVASLSLYAPGPLAVDQAQNIYIQYSTGGLVSIGTNGLVTAVSSVPGYGSAFAVDRYGNVVGASSYGIGRWAPDQSITSMSGPVASVSFANTRGVAMDAVGNVIVSYGTSSTDAMLGRVVRVAPDGTVQTIAGPRLESTSVSPTLPLPATPVVSPRAVARDNAGNLYVSKGRSVIRITPEGDVNPFAGGGTCSATGDLGPATSACLKYVTAIAFDRAGNVLLADSDDSRVRKVDATGIISTIAGTGAYPASGDGGLAVNAGLDSLDSMAVTSAGEIYLANRSTGGVRKIAADGTISTLARQGNTPVSATPVAANSTTIYPRGLAVDTHDNLYIALGNGVARLTPDGQIALVAGGGMSTASEGAPALSATMNALDVKLDASNNLFISELGRIRTVSSNGIIQTIAGTGAEGNSGDGGAALSAQFSTATSMVIDPAGNVFFVDTKSGTVRVLTPRSSTALLNATVARTTEPATAPSSIAYTATVSNSSLASATSGTVTLRNVAPAGAQLQSLSGAGWSCDVMAAACTRSDVLAPGASYPPVAVNVSYDATTLPQLLNTVVVSGGGSPAATGDSDISNLPRAYTLRSLAPSSVVIGSATQTLVVWGTGFDTGSTVQWNGTPLTTTFVNSTQLKATLPSTLLTTPASASVTVLSPTNGLSSAAPFGVIGSQLNALSPNYADEGGAAFALTLRGDNFQSDAVPMWGSTPLTVSSRTATKIVATVPSTLLQQAGTFQIALRYGSGVTSASLSFRVNPRPVSLTGVTPASVPQGSSDMTITLTGTGFQPGIVASSGMTKLQTNYVSATQVTAVVPTALMTPSSGYLSLTVLNPDGGTAGPISVPINAAPQLAGVSPHFAQAGAGPLTLTLSVNGYVSPTAPLPNLLWGGTTKLPVTLTSNGYAATIPANLIATPGTTSLKFVNLAGVSTGDAVPFPILAPPVISSINPTSIMASDSRSSITVNGTNFTAGDRVAVTAGGVSLVGTIATKFISSTQLVAPLGWIYSAGQAAVTVVHEVDYTGNTVSAPVPLTINPRPTFESLSPASAIAGGEDFTLTLKGSGFLPGTQMLWNGSPLVTSQTGSTQLAAQVPAALIERVRTVTIGVVLPGDFKYSFVLFEVKAGPVAITSLSPRAVTKGADAFTLTVLGTGFKPHSALRWGATTLATTYVSATKLTAAVPASLVSAPASIDVVALADSYRSPAASFFVTPDEPALNVVLSHSGNFAQGQTGAVYTAIVSNVSPNHDTTSAVSVAATLPSGLTLVSMSGTGWNCAASTCTRADGLTAGASYPPIAITVNVAANAPASVTSTVAASGGGSAAASASDMTTITATVTAPVLVAPADRATGQALMSVLSWNAVAGADSYDVYLGTPAAVVKVATVTTTSYTPAPALAVSTTYAWRIVANNATSTASSPTWTFMTLAPVGPPPSDGGGGIFFPPAACVSSVTPNDITLSGAGGTVSIAVKTESACAWKIVNVPEWISIASGMDHTGDATVVLTVTVNTTPAPRAAVISFGGITVSLKQGAPCNCTLAQSGQGFDASGGTGSIDITAEPDCVWALPSMPSWVTVTDKTSGQGSATVAYKVAANTGARRSVSMVVDGSAYTIDQNGATPVNAGALTHFAIGGKWQTQFTLVNTGYGAARASLQFYSDLGTLIGTQSLGRVRKPADAASSTALNNTLNAGAMVQATPPVSINTGNAESSGWAQLITDGTIDGYGVFQLNTGSGMQEAVVPPETRAASSYYVPFDNTGGYFYGVALSNTTAAPLDVNVVIRDATTGATTITDTLKLGANGHQSFVMTQQYTSTANARGTIEFTTAQPGQVSVLGLRFNPNHAFTTVPALVASAPGANKGLRVVGSMPQVAAGQGWKTLLTLANPGTTEAVAHLDFYGDNGGPMTVNIMLPQSPDTAIVSASSFERKLAPGTMIEVLLDGPADVQSQGWARLSSDGAVTGFAAFQYAAQAGQQEAAVPLESRDARSYLLALDNLNGYFNGIAIANVTSTTVPVKITIRDAATGKVLKTDMLEFSPVHHAAFLLKDRYPAVTASAAVTVEFSTVEPGCISVLGLRFNANTAFTSVPALVKQ